VPKPQESEQQINDFSLAGFNEKAQKTWDLSAKSADMFSDSVKLKNIVGNLYGEQEDIKLIADKGDYDKTNALVHLEENVVITTSKGAKLTTDSLDWDRKNQLVSTKDKVNIERGNMITVAEGAKGEPNLNRVTLEKDVTVNINPTSAEGKSSEPAIKNKITITCDGPLQIDYDKNLATFNNNVKVDTKEFLIHSDKMDVYFSMSKEAKAEATDKISVGTGATLEKIVASGNVRIIRGENISYSDEAIYTLADKKISLLGKPKLVIYSTEDFSAPSGN
jgi:LPS export ABC transporter protein LptC